MSFEEYDKQFKVRVLDSKSPSFCGAKWYNASLHFFAGWTTSCHHNPPHQIDLEEIKKNPSALHNTTIKKNERKMMLEGERPLNCQYCWVIEDSKSTNLSDRVVKSQQAGEEECQTAYDSPWDADFDLTYAEICFDRTCQLSCSYCCPAISSSWAKEIRNKGPYIGLDTDRRKHYIDPCDDLIQYNYKDENPYADAFFKWWDKSLHKTIKHIRISGGEPMMSGHTWHLLEWLIEKYPKTREDFVIDITTNLAYNDDILDKLLDYASKIKREFRIWTSGESIYNKFEYIRSPIDWNQWERNFKKVLNSNINSFGICTTPGALSAESYVDFLEWLSNIKEELYTSKSNKNIQLSANMLRFPTFQSALVLPYNMRKQYHDRLHEFINTDKFNNLFDEYEKNEISRWCSYLIDVESPHQEQIKEWGRTYNSKKESQFSDMQQDLQKDFKRFFTQFDQRRNKSFTETFPNYKEWWDSIEI